MPVKSKFTAEDIIDAAFLIVRSEGAEKCSARAIAHELNSSTMPIYSCLSSMKELKEAVLKKALDLLISYETKVRTGDVLLDMGIGYIMFAKTEKHLFRMLFPVTLTDNGSEFSNPSAIESAPDGSRRTSVFYCDACASWQKGGIERGHEFLRMVLPKGTDFDGLTREDVNLVLSHANSYSRPSREDKSPYDLFAFRYGTDLLDRLGIRRIAPGDIVLKPSLPTR